MKRSISKLGKNAARRIGAVVPLALRDKELSNLSPVPQLLTCNLPPSDAEIPLILNAIVDTEQTLSTIEQELMDGSLSNQSLKALRKRKSKNTEFLRMHRSLLSPLRRLPADILSEIFTQVAYSRLGNYATPPWAISQTCNEWRSLALDLPLLWSFIDVELRERHKTHSFLQHLDMFLNRSRRAPLDVCISSDYFGPHYVQHPVINILMAHSERWHDIGLHLSGQTLQVFNGIKGRLHGLRSLSLTLFAPFPDGVIDMFEVAPRLQEIVIDGISAPNRLVIPWMQVINITYRDSLENMNTRNEMLASSSSVQNLDFNCRNLSRLSTIQIFPSVRLQKLLRFSLVFSSTLHHTERLPKRFLDGLTLPGVEELQLINYYGSGDSAVTSLIIRSHASLRKLEFSSPTALGLLPGALTSILQLTPQLTDLITTLPNHTDLSNLIISPQQPNMVPSLRHLVLHVPRSGINSGLEEVITSVVISRCSAIQAGDATSAVQESNSIGDPLARAPMSIRLVFYDLNQCFSTHELLENVYPNPASKEYIVTEEILNELAILRSRLMKYLSPMSSYVRVSKNPGIKGISNQVMKLFDEIDAFQFADVKELYASKLHHILYHISKIIENADLIKRETTSWKEKAYAILNRWNISLLINDLPNRHWAFQGYQSIVYTPTESGTVQLESDPNAALKKIYGTRFYSGKYDERIFLWEQPSDLQCRD